MAEPRNRAVQLEQYGGPENLRVVNIPLASAGLGEVRVRVLASSINYTETLIRRHLYHRLRLTNYHLSWAKMSSAKSTKSVRT